MTAPRFMVSPWIDNLKQRWYRVVSIKTGQIICFAHHSHDAQTISHLLNRSMIECEILMSDGPT